MPVKFLYRYLIPAIGAIILVGCALDPISRTSEQVERNGGISVHRDMKLDLNLCNTHVSNPPDVIARRVLRESAFACVNKKRLLLAPAPEACMTSGYGPRWGKIHHGIDYQALPAGPVVAAGAGIVRIMEHRKKDFGNWIVIEHGDGVFTAYGHLARFAAGLHRGRHVEQGEFIGLMGKTGNGTSAVHLHFEIRRGRLPANGNFFSLKSLSPYDLPEYCD